MVLPCRRRPISGAREQRFQVAHRVADIGLGVEAGLHAGEGVGVVQQVDLHAADVDRPRPGGQARLHLGDRLLAAGHVAPFAGGVEGPRPGLHPAGRRASAGLDAGDGAQQAGRQAGILVGKGDRPGAGIPGLVGEDGRGRDRRRAPDGDLLARRLDGRARRRRPAGLGRLRGGVGRGHRQARDGCEGQDQAEQPQGAWSVRLHCDDVMDRRGAPGQVRSVSRTLAETAIRWMDKASRHCESPPNDTKPRTRP